MSTEQLGEEPHSFQYYLKCMDEVKGLRDYLTAKGFGVECRTEGAANTAIHLLEGLFQSFEPVDVTSAVPKREGEWCGSEDQVPGGLPHGVDNGNEALDLE